MKVTENQTADLASIDPTGAEAYLRARDWTHEGGFRDVESYWRFAERGQELVLPLQPEFGDYALRMSQVVDSLAGLEERSSWHVLRDLLTANMDVVSLSVNNDGAEDGSISLPRGVELFENARTMLVSVARSVVQPRPSFLGGPPAEVTRYVKGVRVGQSERGSYVVNLLSPVAATRRSQPDDDQIFDDRDYQGDAHFARSVIDMLEKALRSTEEATEQSKIDATYRAFVNGVYSGVSANLCEALVKINESSGERGVKVNLRWAYTLPERGRQRRTFEFDPSSVPVLREAAAILRETDPFEDYLLTGRVIGLHRDELIRMGRVTVKADVEGVNRNVIVDLARTDYSEAVFAHDSGLIVGVRGRLRHTGTRWFLEEPREFSILEDRPLSPPEE